MYLQLASKDASLSSVITSKLDEIVVASNPTHIKPKLLIVREKKIEDIKKS